MRLIRSSIYGKIAPDFLLLAAKIYELNSFALRRAPNFLRSGNAWILKKGTCQTGSGDDTRRSLHIRE